LSNVVSTLFASPTCDSGASGRGEKDLKLIIYIETVALLLNKYVGKKYKVI